MKLIHSITLTILVTNLYLTACDDETKQLILNARTPESLQDTHCVTHANFDNKNTTDVQFAQIFAAASQLVKLSMTHHSLYRPKPVVCNNLTELNLQHGTLIEFPIGSFIRAMPNLTTLDLSHNNINSIESPYDGEDTGPCDAKPYPWTSHHLKKLYLNNNNLSTVDLVIINNAYNLTCADLSDNPLAYVRSNYYRLNYRALCTIKLHNTKLTAIQKEDLRKQAQQNTELFDNRSIMGISFGSVIGAAGGFAGVALATWLPHIPPITGGLFALAIVGSMAVGVGTGGLVGKHTANCCTPADQGTYQAFAFDFGTESTTLQHDDTSIIMPLLQNMPENN